MTNVELLELAHQSVQRLRELSYEGREYSPGDKAAIHLDDLLYEANLKAAQQLDDMEAERQAKKAAKEAAEPYNIKIKSEVKIK